MGRIEIIRGDITLLNVEVIINAANRSLSGGGGVDGAIHRAAGPELQRSCEALNGCNTGEAKITPGFKLPSRYVIHTAGPIWQDGNHHEKELLASCYTQSLRLALEKKLFTIAFPNISTGIYGFPKMEAATIAIETVCDFLVIHPDIKQIVFCCFDEENFHIYNGLISANLRIERVQSRIAIQITANLASTIWNEHYVPIIGQEQVNYMVAAFQSEEAIENQINSGNYEYYLLYQQSDPAGYIAIKHTGDELFLSKFYVLKQKRGTGLGKEGLKFIIKRARDLGTGRITLTVNKYNINSIKAYEKMGFRNDGSVIADIGAGYVMDDYRMSYTL
jgi:O-acetyl-ADP-ribose deacetylase (regulator of RNase III)/RimJ/RimL family protein N-acetyltransferase